MRNPLLAWEMTRARIINESSRGTPRLTLPLSMPNMHSEPFYLRRRVETKEMYSG